MDENIAAKYATKIKEFINSSGKTQEDIANEIADNLYEFCDEDEVKRFRARFRKTLSDASSGKYSKQATKTIKQLENWYEYLQESYSEHSYRKAILGEDAYGYFYKT